VRVAGFEVVGALVGAGIGVAVMPASAARRVASPTTRVLPLQDRWAAGRELVVCHRPGARERPGVAAFVDSLFDDVDVSGTPADAARRPAAASAASGRRNAARR
jgi:DNA-binding transcriptional LysR family regulator